MPPKGERPQPGNEGEACEISPELQSAAGRQALGDMLAEHVKTVRDTVAKLPDDYEYEGPYEV